MQRRTFLQLSATATAGLLLPSARAANTAAPQLQIPRWRGFNLTELAGGKRGQRYRRQDFQWMADWGFNFARLPCSYWAWSTKEKWHAIDDKALAPLDEAIGFGLKHGIHLNLCLHRIPGYCVNEGKLEPDQLLDGPRDGQRRALEAAIHHWRTLAQRYQSVPATRLSFDLLNEPPFLTDHVRYVEVCRALIAAIREISPDRIITVDGADLGQTPVLPLLDARVVQSTRGYLPKMVSHHTATWVPAHEFESFEKPAWPMTDAKGVVWDREKLRTELIAKWQPLTTAGAPVHVGEWGCFNQTPHEVALAWMGDLLALWKEAGWGWALWNLRGAFGVVDSGRPDVAYEDFQGHKLDRKMLALLQAG
jgi:endoglucanase